MSLDGISAFDLISRKSMLEGLCRIPGGEQVLPFVRMFHGSPSVHLWEDDSGVVHHIRQGEGHFCCCPGMHEAGRQHPRSPWKNQGVECRRDPPTGM